MKETINWSFGDTCWFETNCSECPGGCGADENSEYCFEEGILITVETNGDILYGTVQEKDGSMTTILPLMALATSKEALVMKNDLIKQKYLAEIKNVGDLVNFMFVHCINGYEYTDRNARAVVIKKMSDFGINQYFK